MVESLREWESRKGSQKWTLPVSVVTLINIPSDRASIPFDEDNGAENISWKRATTFSSDFMVLRMRESTDCWLFAVFLNECKGIHPFSYMWNRLFFPHELQKEEWCSLKKHMPVASHLTPLNNQRIEGWQARILNFRSEWLSEIFPRWVYWRAVFNTHCIHLTL